MPRRPDLPCSECGKLMWRGATSLPEGQARCRDCRRGTHGSRPFYDAGCRCETCRAGHAERQRGWAATYREKHGHSMYKKHRKVDERRWINPKIRAEIYERDGWVCQLCTEPVDPSLDPNDRMAATLDHVECQSWALIPDDSPANLRLAHRACNSRRRDGYGREAAA